MADPTVTSNADQIGAWLDGFVDSFDFERPGADGSLGRDIAGVVAKGIQDRSVAQGLDAAGGPFKENAPWYRAWKRKKYQAHQPGILSGQMLSTASLIGETEVNGDEIIMRYGTGEQGPAESSTGVTMVVSKDKKTGKPRTPPTDKEKAEWFTASGRPFYELDATISAEAAQIAGESLGDHLKGNA